MQTFSLDSVVYTNTQFKRFVCVFILENLWQFGLKEKHPPTKLRKVDLSANNTKKLYTCINCIHKVAHSFGLKIYSVCENFYAKKFMIIFISNVNYINWWHLVTTLPASEYLLNTLTSPVKWHDVVCLQIKIATNDPEVKITVHLTTRKIYRK